MSNHLYNLATHNGKITVLNKATGNHRTFGVRTQPKDANFAPNRRVVALLTGKDNERDYTSFGFVEHDGSIRLFRSKDFGEWRAYANILTHPDDFIRRGCEFMFEGRCRVCNRLLTTPESIQSGIGPVCDGKPAKARRRIRQAKYKAVVA